MLDKSKSDEEENKREFLDKMAINLSSRERNFIIISDILIVGFVTIDLLAFTDLININMGLLSLVNLPMIAFSYYYFKFKKRMTIKALSEVEKNG
jgi:uncharacterized membrane-anchored protein YitT (DUF2179 family)